MPFVVVVHLDPNRQSELAEILAQRTRMPVTQVVAPAALEPGRVFVIPPNRRLVINDHEIGTAEFDEPRGKRAPIDLLFRSMAAQYGDDVAIVLTGAGSDGALGIKAVKERGGIIMVQDPGEAEYGSMPSSAIATGLADFVLPVREMAAQLVEVLRKKELLRDQKAGLDDEETVRAILGHLRARSGHDFAGYKRGTVLRRLARRMQIAKADRLQEYLGYLEQNVEEAQALFSDLLISVTTFFRDPDAYAALAKQAVPGIFDRDGAGEAIRVWVPGCATGEEAYSLAMLFLEEATRRGAHAHIQVFATDLDAGALATARQGCYPLSIEADVAEDRLRRFFLKERDHYRVRPELRDAVLFAPHSLLRDPPFSRLDLVSCRNLLIYLDRELQRQACNALAYGLRAGGYLFLGSSESIDPSVNSFHVVDRQARIFQNTQRRVDVPALPKVDPTPIFLRPSALRGREPIPMLGAEELHRQTLEELAPPSILVDEHGKVLNLSESAGRYLQHPGGPLTSDIIDLVRPELRLDLRTALHRVFDANEATLSLPMQVHLDGRQRQIYLQARPAASKDGPRVALVLFIEGEPMEETPGAEEAEDEPGPASALRRLREELQSTRSRLTDSRAEFGTAIEELRAANEELQSTNEEYRSTAEELETSKEELQSMNEELQTVNAELKVKLAAVSRAHSDIQNLITATDVGTLFLDSQLRIKMYTPRIEAIFNITASDVGRPVTDFTHRLEYTDVAADAQRVFEHLAPVELEIRSQQDRWYLMRLRPYRSIDGKIEGVVATFVDITERRRADEALRQSHAQLQSHAQELSRFNRAAVGRELRMIELKKEINKLRQRDGEPPGYPLEFEHDDEASTSGQTR